MQTNTTKRNRFFHRLHLIGCWFRGTSALKKTFFVIGIILLLLYVVWLVQFFWPRSVVLSYSEPTCAASFIPLPALYQANGSDLRVSLQHDQSSRWLSRDVCIYPARVPVPGDTLSTNVSLRWLPWFGQRLAVEVPQYPKVLSQSMQGPSFVAISDALEISFSGEDQLFAYEIAVDKDMASACEKQTVTLRCDLSPLELVQAEDYEIHLHRLFDDIPVERLATKQIRTLDPLELVESSIADGDFVYEKPDTIELTFDKQLHSDQSPDITVEIIDEPVDFTYDMNGTLLGISFLEELPRKSTIELVISKLLSENGAALEQDVIVQFETSGGPEVAENNITTSMSQQASLEVVFDQPLSAEQDIADFVELRANDNLLDIEVSISDDSLVMRPQSFWPRCAVIILAVEGEMLSSYDVSSSVSWRTEGRITCRQSEQIGQSVQGRPIMAHRFGNGPNTVLYVGGMHGNEYSSVILMERWLEELDRHPKRIPNDKTIIVIPESCPDCVAARSRLNASNVDLNRNFPTDDWQPEVYIPGPTHLPEGGGTEALSEPESAALTALVRRERPVLTLTYHAVADIVISNDAGRSAEWGREYARLSGYDFSTTNDIENVFNYQATGAFEDWIHDEFNLPALLIELSTMASDEMQNNRDALWYTVTR